jgi:hypothetical protein
MDSVEWNVFAAGAAVVAGALLALVGLSRRKTKRGTASGALAAIGEPKRRIDLVAIDESSAAKTAEDEVLTEQQIPTRDERSFDV